MKVLKNTISVLFLIVAVGNIYANYATHELLETITKPLITCLLALLYLISVKKANFWVVSALFFSFWGDVLLLFRDQYFVFGLASFLLAHILYINATTKFLSKIAIPKLLAYSLPFVVFLISLMWLLAPNLGEMLIPVIVYGIVISVFGVVSLLVYVSEKSKANLWLMLGAFTFITSDSILAINKFYQPIEYSGVFIMTTYIVAQFLLCKAFIGKD